MEKDNRVEKLLVLILLNSIKSSTIAQKAVQLSLAGFSNVEIADLLETSPSVIAQSLYASRKGKMRKKK